MGLVWWVSGAEWPGNRLWKISGGRHMRGSEAGLGRMRN